MDGGISEWVPTFNLNGDRPNAVNFLNAKISNRQMVGKNVCHTILFTREVFEKREVGQVKNTAAWKLFEEAASLYFERHDFKKFHDPTAACCHLFPKIGVWFPGKTTKMESGWTTFYDGDCGDAILAEVDHDKFWQQFFGFGES